ncbi:hypothetical protein [Lutibacter maritimus]|uniref:NfeD-like C-terminal, partner-binding n=1 Tax=Lutibacter maritimus TaxID=593133 RepID=A0A1I6PFI5_9FLAO|nr:hypothetical protein [Lutibacter maritimus]SFS38913.1 hypothetical protein SAMN04488006_0979 [Lutibacter maritimus]
MKDFFTQLSTLEQTYWIIALVGSAVFIVIFFLTFIGGADSDMDTNASEFQADDGGVGFQFFTFKGIVAFFTIFGWTGITCLNNGFSSTATIIIATIAGLIMMVITSSLFYWMHKLAESGTLNINNAVGVIGEVYLPIGAERSKMGKVQIKVQGSLRELEAITDELEDLKTGAMVKVSKIVSAEILLVEKISK